MIYKTATTCWKVGLGLVLLSGPLMAQERLEETITRSYTLPDPSQGSLILQNINGAVTVEGYAGNTIEVSVAASWEGKNARGAAQAKEEVVIKDEQKGNTVWVYVSTPGAEITLREDGISYNQRNWNPTYDHRFHYTVRVPRQMQVQVSTIQHGDVVVTGVLGGVHARNINGHVTLKGVGGPNGEAHTINGDIHATFVNVPTEDAKFHTINGTIDVTYPESLGAELSFESFNGDFFTDFDYEELPTKVTTNTEAGSTTRYKLEALSSIKVGAGGPHFHFNNFNGDTYIRKQR